MGSSWLAPLVEAGEGISIIFSFQRQSRDKILSKIAQTTMVNRSQMRDVGDTRQDYEELDSAIASGLYLKDAINRNGEDFYYMVLTAKAGLVRRGQEPSGQLPGGVLPALRHHF